MFTPRRISWLIPVVFPVLILALPSVRTKGTASPHVFPDAASDDKNEHKPIALDMGRGVKMDFVVIPKGKYEMGAPKDEDGRYKDEEQHEVEITPDYYLGKFEVTRGQFRVFVQETNFKTEAETDGLGGSGYDEETGKFKGPTWDARTGKHNGGTPTNYTWRDTGFSQTDDHPVVNVSWNDATAFCRWLAGKTGRKTRLPSEAEWEYACRAGTKTRFYNGDDAEKLASVGNVADGTARKVFSGWTTIDAEDGYVYTAPVGKFKPNKFGLHDMHGNVWEWCLDWYGPYKMEQKIGAIHPRRERQAEGGLYGPRLASERGQDWFAVSYQEPILVNPLRADKLDYSAHIVRGGSWADRPGRCRSAARRGLASSHRCHHVGFRVAFRQEQKKA
ncbi:MAG: formylglycine-generating enzyme family protein [Gemmataceae bacterium]